MMRSTGRSRRLSITTSLPPTDQTQGNLTLPFVLVLRHARSHSVWLPGFWVLRIPHRKRKRLNLDSPSQASVSGSLPLCSLTLCFRHLTQTATVDGCIRMSLVRLPTSTSALRGQRLDSLLDRHPLYYLAMCKPGTYIVAVSSEQGLHSDGVLLQTGGRQMQQGNLASY